MARIEFIDQSLRDGQQSLWGMRMQAGMALPVADLIDRVGYHVVVTAGGQPANPVQTCSVSSGAGTVGSTDVDNVSVNCATNYTFGGTVTGLASGSTLVLANGATTLNVTGGGGPTSFNFPAIPSGTGYDVTVQTNPSSPIAQTCTVTRGSGTVIGANVTNIAVTCTTNTYTVRVAVTGHSSTTTTGGGTRNIVLRNNGGDDLTVTGNGTSSFTTQIASGSGYNVMVFANPTNPQQVCTVTSGSGTIVNADVTVDVACVRTTRTIGGIVNGLANGKAIVLRNGAGSELTVSGPGPLAASTSFVFPAVPNGSSWELTIRTQPSAGALGLSQDCRVRNFRPDGTISSFNPANVTDLIIDCGRTCNSIKRASAEATTGIHSINPDGQQGDSSFDVHCDMSFDGGGWTLIMRTTGNNGPGNTATDNDDIVGGNRRLSDARVQALARVSLQVHIRDDVNAVTGATRYVTTAASSGPNSASRWIIQNLRELRALHTGFWPEEDRDRVRAAWTQNALDSSMFDFTELSGNTSWPSIYHAQGNDEGFQYYGSISAWQKKDNEDDGLSKRVYVK